MKYLIVALCAVLLFNSCKKEYESIESIDEAKIQAYLQKNNIEATKDPAGFYYQIIEQGTGAPLLNKDSVFYNANIKSLGGVSYFTPTYLTFDAGYLGYVNPAAYRIAMGYLNRGGKVKLIVPSYLAFGKNGLGTVPSNEVIVSEISVFPETALWQVQDRLISEFIATKGLTGFTRLPSRVYRSISTLGTGTTINPGSTIKVKYEGRLLNGVTFDKSDELERAISALIVGWTKGLTGIPAGTKLRMFIPSDLAYGASTSAMVPVNSILDFDVEVVSVTD